MPNQRCGFILKTGLFEIQYLQKINILTFDKMNFYDLENEIEENQYYLPQEDHDEVIQHEDEPVERFDTFSGYLPEEQLCCFTYVEEPKKQEKLIRRSRKIKKVDSETDVPMKKKVPVSSDLAKLQQCQMLKTIISQMESILQNTRTQILNEFLKNK